MIVILKRTSNYHAEQIRKNWSVSLPKLDIATRCCFDMGKNLLELRPTLEHRGKCTRRRAA